MIQTIAHPLACSGPYLFTRLMRRRFLSQLFAGAAAVCFISSRSNLYLSKHCLASSRYGIDAAPQCFVE
jgi:hypothetical protein